MIERLETSDAVIVVGPDAAEVGEAVRGAKGPERVAGLIGSPDDPRVQAALDEMRRELFGS
jgi:hypothetical protein